MARHNSRPLLMRLTTTRTQGAFLISILLALVALTHTSLAQLPGEEIPLDSTARARGILWGVRMKAWVGGVHFSPSGSFLVATADSTYFLDPTNARVIKAFQKYGYTSISSDEQYLLGFDYRDSSVVKVRIDDGKTVARHRFDSLSNWSSCTFTKDGNYCVVVQATPWKTIDPSPPSRPSWIFFNMNTGEVVHRKNFIREPGIRRASIQDVVFDCNEEHIIAGCEKRWDTSGSGRTYYFKKETGDSSDMVTLGADGPAGTSVQFSSTCNYMATSLWWKYDTPDDGLSVYNTATKERLVHLKMATSGIRREFTPDEKYLVVAKDGILLYELSTGKLVFANDWATITTLAVAPNKNVVATHFSTSGALFMQQLPTSTTDVTHSDIHSDILYPNPSTGAVEIKCTLPRAGVLTMTVSTSDGRVVRTMMQPATDGENRFAIPTADLSSGGYLLRCTMGGGYSQTYSFIITK